MKTKSKQARSKNVKQSKPGFASTQILEQRKLELWRTQFGDDYAPPAEILALIAAGTLEDDSWRNDAAPKFTIAGTRYELWVEHADPKERETGNEGSRFWVVLNDEDGAWVETTLETNSVQDVLAEILRIKSPPAVKDELPALALIVNSNGTMASCELISEHMQKRLSDLRHWTQYGDGRVLTVPVSRILPLALAVEREC